MERNTSSEPDNPYPAEYFRRIDESDDSLFYIEPRLLVHIEDNAIAAIGSFFESALPHNGVLLDLMSSWRSHLPQGFAKEKLVGVGLNDVEMADNPQLDEWLVHDLNADPYLPYENETFDAAFVTVSIQYMIRPIEVFSEVNRVLKSDGRFHVIYSNRMFPTKAVAVWQALDDAKRAQLIASYFSVSGGWQDLQALDISPKLDTYTDPVFVVTATKSL